MTFTQFLAEVDEARKTNPRILMLDSDAPGSPAQIARAEQTLGVLLPESYAQFVKRFGGGFFGFSLVYSLDEASEFYLLSHNTADSAAKHGYVAVIDYETGDTAGFRVENGQCGEQMWRYDHESGRLQKLPYEDLLSFLAANALRPGK